METRPPKYPWRQMRVGETILIMGKTRRNVQGCVSHLTPMRFSFRSVVVGGEPAVRVWRIA